MSEEPTSAPLTPLRALLLLGVVIVLFVLEETYLGLFAAAVWLLLVVLYGRRHGVE